jgi:hypothetical protein
MDAHSNFGIDERVTEFIRSSRNWKILTVMQRLMLVLELDEELTHEEKEAVLSGLLNLYKTRQSEPIQGTKSIQGVPRGSCLC